MSALLTITFPLPLLPGRRRGRGAGEIEIQTKNLGDKVEVKARPDFQENLQCPTISKVLTFKTDFNQEKIYIVFNQSANECFTEKHWNTFA